MNFSFSSTAIGESKFGANPASTEDSGDEGKDAFDTNSMTWPTDVDNMSSNMSVDAAPNSPTKVTPPSTKKLLPNQRRVLSGGSPGPGSRRNEPMAAEPPAHPYVASLTPSAALGGVHLLLLQPRTMTMIRHSTW
jgi:hypothetical protein